MENVNTEIITIKSIKELPALMLFQVYTSCSVEEAISKFVSRHNYQPKIVYLYDSMIFCKIEHVTEVFDEASYDKRES